MDEMIYQVPVMNIIAIAITLIISIGLPVALITIWKKKSDANVWIALVGVGTFIFFVMMLEEGFKFCTSVTIGRLFFREVSILLAVYTGLTAGIIEEIGRFLIIKLCKRVRFNHLTKENAVMFGIGFGGAESVFMVGLTYISNLSSALTINSGSLKEISSASIAKLEQLANLRDLPWQLFLLATLENMAKIMLHICLSYLVYRAVKDRRFFYCLIAMALHALVSFEMVILSSTVGIPTPVATGVLVLVVAAWTVATTYMYSNEKGNFQSLKKNNC